jgi:hypothetical protein
MRAASREFFDCGLDESEDFFRLVRVGGEQAATSGNRVDGAKLMVESFKRVSQTSGRAVKTFKRASQVLGQVVETFKRVSTLFRRAANLLSVPFESSVCSAQTSNRAPYNFSARV